MSSGLRGLRAWDLETPQEEHWSGRASCKDARADPEWWHSDEARDTASAVSWCASCPVRLLCLAEAYEVERDTVRSMLWGVRAGYTPKQRFRLYRGKPAGSP